MRCHSRAYVVGRGGRSLALERRPRDMLPPPQARPRSRVTPFTPSALSSRMDGIAGDFGRACAVGRGGEPALSADAGFFGASSRGSPRCIAHSCVVGVMLAGVRVRVRSRALTEGPFRLFGASSRGHPAAYCTAVFVRAVREQCACARVHVIGREQ